MKSKHEKTYQKTNKDSGEIEAEVQVSHEIEVNDNEPLGILLQRKQKTEQELRAVESAMFMYSERRIGLTNQNKLLDELIVSVSAQMPSQKPETESKKE